MKEVRIYMDFAWSDVWNCLMGISAPVSAIGMLFITHYVYKMTNKNSLKENYFRHMVELYYRIEKDSKKIVLSKTSASNVSVSELDNCEKELACRRIKVNCTLMIYYLLRIPGYYKGRTNFECLLIELSKNPYETRLYVDLADFFNDFCWEFKGKKKENHTFNLDYKGEPLRR